MGQTSNFVVVANRLPVDISVDEAGNRRWQHSPGGLVTALSPILAAREGAWVGWPGTTGKVLAPDDIQSPFPLIPVELSQRDYEEFYEGFSNATLWPLYHDLIVTPQYHRAWWDTYREVNARFAATVAEVAAPGATVWVQDYQLQLVPQYLSELRPDCTIGYFCHIPFPGADLFRQLPWREEIINGLLKSHVIGFHLESSAENFRAVLRRQHPELTDATTPIIGAYPISIDTAEVTALAQAATPHHGAELTLLGVDRLDYTKGILQRIEALEELFLEGHLDPHTTQLIQIATPSRERIDHYQQTRRAVEEAVGRINGRFGTVNRPVVAYLHRHLKKEELASLYRGADIMVVNPFKDGMNLVAKEYVASHYDASGALVLSEFAGAAEELKDAYLCNPHDRESIKRAILQAANERGTDDQRRRMAAMVEQVSTHDVHLWASRFLSSVREIFPNGASAVR